MKSESQILLKKYWGYDQFRPGQSEIIEQVVQARDTLGILATGSGKSICYQIPGLIIDGVTIVISPLIALMKDQIDGLKKRSIKAEGLFSSMPHRTQDIILDNVAYGDIKFLFISPERIKNRLFQERIKKFNVGLIVVDEAHCISEWGHDFRPDYRKISNLREQLNKRVPLLALTATATNKVKDDIVESLKLSDPFLYVSSPIRDNIAYYVLYTESKLSLIRSVLKSNQGQAAIIYVSSRRRSLEIEKQLKAYGIRVAAYHGGMSAKLRSEISNAWADGSLDCIVATKAFGMGIDKADVRFVFHYDLPDTLEGYVQEAGRAGRDQKSSKAILLFNNATHSKLKKRLEESMPSKEYIEQVYHSLCRYLKVPIGVIEDQLFPYNHKQFCEHINESSFLVFQSLKFLDHSQIIKYSDNLNQPSKLMLKEVAVKKLLQHEKVSDKMKSFVKLLLRSYEGVFVSFIQIDEDKIAYHFEQSRDKVIEALNWLTQRECAFYKPKQTGVFIDFLTFRRPKGSVIDHELYKVLNDRALKANQSLSHYVKTSSCRQVLISAYFGFADEKPCGLCDNCQTNYENRDISTTVELYTSLNINKVSELSSLFDLKVKAEVIKALSILESESMLRIEGENIVYLNH